MVLNRWLSVLVQVKVLIYDSGNYTEKFEQDIVETEKSIVISSPDIR